MELKKITPEVAAKEKFIANRGKGVERVRKIVSLDDPESSAIIGEIFGATGTGKTKFLAQLAAGSEQYNIPPQRILILGSDLGGNGSRTISGHLINLGKKELLGNIKTVQVDNYEEADDFIKDPYYGLGDFNPDIVAWDGFSYFQNAHLKKYVLDNTEGNSDSNLHEAGLGFDKMDPGFQAMIFGTIQAVNGFCAIRKQNGQAVHKIITCGEDVTQKPVSASNPMMGSTFVDSAKPLLSGRGGKLIEAAFDFIIRTRVSSAGGDEGARKFEYVISGNQNLAAKSREIKLEPVIPADACSFWRTVLDTYGLAA